MVPQSALLLVSVRTKAALPWRGMVPLVPLSLTSKRVGKALNACPIQTCNLWEGAGRDLSSRTIPFFTEQRIVNHKKKQFFSFLNAGLRVQGQEHTANGVRLRNFTRIHHLQKYIMSWNIFYLQGGLLTTLEEDPSQGFFLVLKVTT